MSKTASVNTPCPGQQALAQITQQLYQGLSGDFTLVVLTAHPAYGWLLVVYDQSSPSSPCYPYAQFGQVSPNPQDPNGAYGLLVNGQGTPDPSAGAASVS